MGKSERRMPKTKAYGEYIVSWTVELSATSRYEAAKLALEMLRDPDAIATFFEVASAKGARRGAPKASAASQIELSREDWGRVGW
jgi:hypothetical protein